MWPVFAAEEGNFTLFPFAISGATCASVFASQLSVYMEEIASGSLKLDPKETIYTLWIGTNDVGVHGLLTGQTTNETIVDTTACAVNWLQVLYDSGARNFIFQNVSLTDFRPGSDEH